MVGIVGYGAYVPKYRITLQEIAQVWGKNGDDISRGLNVREKSVPAIDEDTVTISTQAALNAVKHAGINPTEIGALYIGSESHPYAVKPSSTIVAEAICAVPELMAADLEFACKAGTAGMQMCMGLVKSKMIRYGMAIGADTSQGRPGDALEYTASAGGAAYIIGEDDTVAEIEDTYSFTTDTPDFWRREHERYPRHGGRFTGEPAYFRHIVGATQGLLQKTGYKVDKFNYAVFHQPNGKFPLVVAKKLGIPQEKVLPGLLSPVIGNTYSGATPLGLAAILDIAKPGERILATSFGSGAGADAFIINVNKNIEKKRKNSVPVKSYIDRKDYLTYAQYVKFREKIRV